MKQIIIDYFWRIGAHTCWQLDELIKARPSWIINHNSFLLHVSDLRYRSMLLSLRAINLWFISLSNIYKPQVLYLLSIHLAGGGDVNLWCIQYTIELYHSIYAYNQMRLYTTINDALNKCYQYGILSILSRCYNTRSNTVNQHTFTSSNHDDNTWCGNNTYSWLREMYICQLSCWAFPPSTFSVCFYVWFDSLSCLYSSPKPSSSSS